MAEPAQAYADERRAITDAARELDQRMVRFGGRPYWDGQAQRCPDCNGFVLEHYLFYPRAAEYGLYRRMYICRTCHRHSPIDPFRVL